MTPHQFWHEDMRLLEVYQKAYYRNVSFTAWEQGQYNQVAFGVVLSNSFAKKGQKQAEYPQWKDPIERIVKKKPKVKNVETEFRNEQANMNAWLFNK